MKLYGKTGLPTLKMAVLSELVKLERKYVLEGGDARLGFTWTEVHNTLLRLSNRYDEWCKYLENGGSKKDLRGKYNSYLNPLTNSWSKRSAVLMTPCRYSGLKLKKVADKYYIVYP